MSRLSPVQLAALVALLGSVLAVFVPTFLENLHASRLAEPLSGLQRIAGRATMLAAGSPPELAFPATVGRTPEEVPAGEKVRDEAGTWDHPTWQLLGFRMEEPHYFSFDFESHVEDAHSYFVAGAWGDLDGDGQLSRFQVYGEVRGITEPRVYPMQIHREVE